MGPVLGGGDGDYADSWRENKLVGLFAYFWEDGRGGDGMG